MLYLPYRAYRAAGRRGVKCAALGPLLDYRACVCHSGPMRHLKQSWFRGDELRRLRHLAGLSQEEAAKRVQVGPGSWRQWEIGDQSPHPARLAALAALLECRVTDLVSVPETLAGYRILAGLTQPMVATKLGVSRQAVSQWEAGRMGIADQHIGSLAEALGVDPANLPPPEPRSEGSSA